MDTQNNIILKNILSLPLEKQLIVRDIRNQDEVRKFMYTEHLISKEEHLRYLEKLKNDNHQIVFVVISNETPIGVVSVNGIDNLHKKTDWAFYLDKDTRGGLGACLEYCFIDFIFNKLGMEKLNCEVIEVNEAVVKMHKKFGFIEEGFRRENIIKNNTRMGVYFLGLTKTDWEKSRQDIYDKYKNVLEKFKLNIEF